VPNIAGSGQKSQGSWSALTENIDTNDNEMINWEIEDFMMIVKL